MTAAIPDTPQRSYGCSFGCGNPYDFIFVSVVDGTTEFLCLPCMVRLASDMVAAVTEPDNPSLITALQGAGTVDTAPMANGQVKRRGKNAPVTADDDDLISVYEDVITVDELPEEFR